MSTTSVFCVDNYNACNNTKLSNLQKKKTLFLVCKFLLFLFCAVQLLKLYYLFILIIQMKVKTSYAKFLNFILNLDKRCL